MNKAQYDAALATLTAELEATVDERTQERITKAIEELKAFTIEEDAVSE
jgi:hypothetical protein